MPLGRVLSWGVYGTGGGRLAERVGLRVWISLVYAGGSVFWRIFRGFLARRRCWVFLGGFSTFCAVYAHMLPVGGQWHFVPMDLVGSEDQIPKCRWEGVHVFVVLWGMA